jgi:hypothetical protein
LEIPSLGQDQIKEEEIRTSIDENMPLTKEQFLKQVEV